MNTLTFNLMWDKVQAIHETDCILVIEKSMSTTFEHQLRMNIYNTETHRWIS